MSLPLQSVMIPPLPHPSLDDITSDPVHKDMSRPLDESPPGGVSDTQGVTPVVGVASKGELVKTKSVSNDQVEIGATLKKKWSQSLDNIRDAIANLGVD